MTARSAVASLGIVVATVLVAFLAGLAAHALLGLGPMGAAITVSVVVAALFWWRAAEGLSAFGIAILLADSVEYWSGRDLRYLDEVSLLLLVGVALLRHRHRLSVPSVGLREVGLGVMLLGGLGSSLANAVPLDIWVPSLALLAKCFAFFVLVLALRVRPAELRILAATTVPVAVALLAIGLLQFVAPAFAEQVLRLPPLDQQRGSLTVVNSVFTHPALYGWLATFLALFAFGWYVVVRSWWALAAALLLGGTAVLSGRRTPLVGLVAGVAAAVVRQAIAGTARVRTLLTGAAVILVLAVISWPLLGDFYARTFDDYVAPADQASEIFAEAPDPAVIAPMAPRTALYLASAAIARDHLPFGAGLGRFGSNVSREHYSPVYPEYGLDQVYGLKPDQTIAVTDTFWPMILGEAGVIGLAGAVLFFAALGAQLWSAAGAGATAGLRAFTLGGMLVYVDALIRSLTSPVFVAPPIAYFTFGVCAIALSVARSDRSSPATEEVR